MNKVKTLLMVAILTAALSLAPPHAQAVPIFYDTIGHWAYPYISLLADREVVNGNDQGAFYPDHPVTRAEFVAMLNRAFSFSAIGTVKYRDVAPAAWYYSEIARAEAAGYLPEYPREQFGPDLNTSRQEAAFMLSRALELEPLNPDRLAFSDASMISAPYREAIAALFEDDYISGYGDGSFRPSRSISRAEACVMVSNALNVHPVMTEIINVQDFGAVGNGRSDDTAAINRAIEYASARGGGMVFIPAGIYIIDVDTSVRVQDRIDLVLAPDAVLKANPTSSKLNAVVLIGDVSDSSVTGGSIIGDRHEHLGSGGEWGRGIQITGSNHIQVSDVTISSCWGDGIYIGSNSKQNFSGDILIERFAIDDCRRTGITVISSQNITIKDGSISNTHGTVPEAGINLEPNQDNEVMYNVQVENVTTVSNHGFGIDICFCNIPNASSGLSITIKNHTDKNSQAGPVNRSCPHYKGQYVTYI